MKTKDLRLGAVLTAALVLTACAGRSPDPVALVQAQDTTASGTANTAQRASLAEQVTDSAAYWAVQSQLCGLWSSDYFASKVLAAEMRQGIPGLHDRFWQSVRQTATKIEADPVEKAPCGYVQTYGMDALMNLEQLAAL